MYVRFVYVHTLYRSELVHWTAETHRDALNVVTQDLTVPLGAALAQTLATLAAA